MQARTRRTRPSWHGQGPAAPVTRSGRRCGRWLDLHPAFPNCAAGAQGELALHLWRARASPHREGQARTDRRSLILVATPIPSPFLPISKPSCADALFRRGRARQASERTKVDGPYSIRAAMPGVQGLVCIADCGARGEGLPVTRNLTLAAAPLLLPSPPQLPSPPHCHMAPSLVPPGTCSSPPLPPLSHPVYASKVWIIMM